MLTQDKIEVVKKQLRSGIPKGEIKKDLIKEGLTDEEIRRIFTPRDFDMRSWCLLFGIVFVVIGLWAWMAGRGLFLLIFGAALLFLYYNKNQKRKKKPTGQ